MQIGRGRVSHGSLSEPRTLAATATERATENVSRDGDRSNQKQLMSDCAKYQHEKLQRAKCANITYELTHACRNACARVCVCGCVCVRARVCVCVCVRVRVRVRALASNEFVFKSTDDFRCNSTQAMLTPPPRLRLTSSAATATAVMNAHHAAARSVDVIRRDRDRCHPPRILSCHPPRP